MREVMPFLISFLLTALFTPVVIALGRRLGWVAKPRADRWHSKPTALMGGIAIFAATAGAWLLSGDWATVAPVALPAAGIFLLGFVDDRVALRPHIKLIGQIAAAAVLIAEGVQFESLPRIIALPLTLVWVVGITNAVNLLDNMDGLASGVTFISATSVAFYCASRGNLGMVPAVLALAGACAGFLIYNFNPAKIFMGDCGSMFIGFSLAALAVQGTYRSAPNLMVSLLVPVALLAIPIFDTTLVSVARTIHGRSISQGGRDHSSHRMVALGLSERATVVVLYALTALFGGLALAATHLPLIGVLLLAMLLFTGLVVLGLYLGFLKVYADDAQPPAHVRLLGGTPLYKRQLLQVILDLVLIPVAFVGAQLLRFEGDMVPAIKASVLAALPVILVSKLVGLALCRAYRGVWRYAGMVDALTAAVGSLAGSLLGAALLAMFTGFKELSRSALIMDWILFTLLAVAARTGFVALRHLFGMLPPAGAPRVVILGVGSEALTLLHQLRDPHSPERANVVGILDDDPAKQRRALNGVPVLGPISELKAIVAAREVSCCLLGVPPHSEVGETILALCRAQKIAVYRDLNSPPLSPA